MQKSYPTTQMFAECGLNLAQIQIVKNNKTLTSFRFDIEVSESYAENAIPSTNEFTILDALIIEAREIIKAEASRVEAENIRNENEQVRIANENIRISNENNRTEAENQRIESENNRILAETNRANAENAREAAERKRQEDTGNAIDNCNTAAQNANTEAQNAKDAADNANAVSAEIEQKAQNGDFSATISHVEAVSGEPDTEACVENTGTAKDASLLFTIPKGTPAGFGTVTANVVDTGEDDPEVTIETDGTDRQKNFNFTFKNIKGKRGEKGDPGEKADLSVDAVTFTEAGTRANIASGETLPTILGKIKKFFTDLKAVAFSGSYSDLSNKPTIGNGKVIIKQAGTQKGTFTMNQTGDTTIELTDNNTTYANMTAATASAAGKAGLAPAPAAGAQVKYLRGDGTWQSLINGLTATAAGFALDARQGKALNDKITALNSNLNTFQFKYLEISIQSTLNKDLFYTLPTGYTAYNCMIIGMMVLNNGNWRSVDYNYDLVKSIYPGHYLNEVSGNTKLRIILAKYA